MKSVIVGGVLLLSACFNVFFVAGYLRTRSTVSDGASPEARAAAVADRLELKGTERDPFIRALADWLGRAREFRRRHRLETESFWKEVLKEHPDSGALEELRRRGTDVQAEATRESIPYLRRALQSLPAGKRDEFVALIRTRGSGKERMRLWGMDAVPPFLSFCD